MHTSAAQFILDILLLLLHVLIVQTQNWWNFDEQLNPYQIPNFTPLPNRRFTHEAEVGKYGPMVNDVIVNIP
ncbi:hypothetical protein CLF_112796, partial [Clonorchis sinensis]